MDAPPRLLSSILLFGSKAEGKYSKGIFLAKSNRGKNKMCVINAVRNKLIHGIFAVVRDERIFEENYVRKCA